MTTFEQIRDRLPSLYRPEPGDESLLTGFLQSAAAALDTLHAEAGGVMQAHWFEYADRALYDPYFRLSLKEKDASTPAPNDPALLEFPYVDDLARLAAILPLPPWLEPPTNEAVEQYRLRIRRMLALYRNGLGTLEALRRVIEAQLVVNLASEHTPDRPFWLEERPPLDVRRQFIAPLGAPTGVKQGVKPVLPMIGPLMRWKINNDGFEPAPPTVVIEGVEAETDLVDPTDNPLIELYQSGGRRVCVGLGYLGKLAPGQALRLRPAYLSFLGTLEGVQQARFPPAKMPPSKNGEKPPATDPTAPGPWESAGGPAQAIVALRQTQDQALWTATAEQLWRYDGREWEMVLDGLPGVLCLAEDLEHQELIIGAEKGLFRLPVFADDGKYLPHPDPATLNGVAIYTCVQAPDGERWLGTAGGLARLAEGDELELAGADGVQRLQGLPVYAIFIDHNGVFYLGAERGLFRWQPLTGRWHVYVGEEFGEQAHDWREYAPAGPPPDETQVFLPPVYCIWRGPDTSLWLGTQAGICRYVANPVSSLTYQTLLEAFPDLGAGRVNAIAQDERDLVWFGAQNGLYRYDGRLFWQARAVENTAGQWIALGRAELIYKKDAAPEARGAWRFNRPSDQWEHYDPGMSTWAAPTIEPLGTVQTPASFAGGVTALAWCDAVIAELGAWDWAKEQFTFSEEVPAKNILVKAKPEDTRCLAGGIPALPRLPPGESTWRYLSVEPDGYEPPKRRPAYTVEGRLLLEDSKPLPEGVAEAIADEARGVSGRYEQVIPLPEIQFDAAVFAYNPAARVWFGWNTRQDYSVLARLKTLKPGESLDPLVLERVWQGMNLVRPAGLRLALAVEEEMEMI